MVVSSHVNKSAGLGLSATKLVQKVRGLSRYASSEGQIEIHARSPDGRSDGRMSTDRIGIVVIGRNEGERLKRCLLSIPVGYLVIYVDSGSSDGSAEFAGSTGAIVVELEDQKGFTAARARNAGWRRLLEHDPETTFIQFIDGDCEVEVGWFTEASSAIRADERLAIVFGRRRERFPERSIYNTMCDDEWDVPIGIVTACGGDALVRVTALREAGGYSDDLIAGEEPDLCLRLGRAGWQVRRIDAAMTLHDANILRFSSWWRRARRAGYAYAMHVWRHGMHSLLSWRRSLLSILFWGLILPATLFFIAAGAVALSPNSARLAFVAIVLIYILQYFRIFWRKRHSGRSWRFAAAYAGLVLVGKIAEISGVLQCCLAKLRGHNSALIEYK
jgi:GT2 family glycosyltransferase